MLMRLLNWLRLRNDTLVCMRQENTWCRGSNLGPITPGACTQCAEPIYFERQNRVFRKKVCHVCAMSGAAK